MIRINQLKLPVEHTSEQLEEKVKKILHKAEIKNWRIWKKSMDARKKDSLHWVYAIDVDLGELEERFLKRNKNQNIQQVTQKQYQFPQGSREFQHPPIVVGMGPAGIFAGLLLAREGLRPILLERGKDVFQRTKDVELFWNEGILDTQSNVQFGEGGAGTFSDGKLNTLVKDKYGRNRFVLETLVEFGAPDEILYESKPHIGTDLLCKVVANIREEILHLGGTVRFGAQLTDLVIENGAVTKLQVNQREYLDCDAVILAPGHSARDTFEMLERRNLKMHAKAFAIGVRVEHSREMINQSQYGSDWEKYQLPAASYKLTYHAKKGRSVYSFCMCPGGYVVNASSESGRLTVNGMSNHDRMGKNSNSAIIVSVTPSDFEGTGPLAGIEFQRKWETLAYQAGNGQIPVQRLIDFRKGVCTKTFQGITPNAKGKTNFANLRECLPTEVSDSIVEAMEYFETKIKGFNQDDTVLSGIEARTSSPVRLERDELFQSSIKGLYPCGEGAGYAGGITSAAMDGIKVAEAVVTV